MPLLILLLLAVFPAASFAAALSSVSALVLDAGHGADDPLVRPQAAAEFAMCQRLAAALKEVVDRENGGKVAVVFTFTAKKDPRQTERAYAANSAGGKLFISFHAAAAFGKPAKAAVIIPDAPEAPQKSWKWAAKKHAAKSARVAQSLKAELATFYGFPYVIAGAAPLWVFHGVDMPAAAVDVLFPDDAGAPASTFYPKLAEALYLAIAEYDK